MKQGSTIFLRAVIIIMGLAVLAICVFALPAIIRSGEAGLYLPIMYGLYVAALPFFWALYQTIKLLGYIDRNLAFDEVSVTALRQINASALVISSLFVIGMPWIYMAAERDDAPGVIVIGLTVIGASLAIAVFATVLQKLLHSAIAIKAEHDLTV